MSNKLNIKKIESIHMSTVGPKDKCPCGSGRKFKKCCGLSASFEHEEEIEKRYFRIRQIEHLLVTRLLNRAEDLFESKDPIKFAWRAFKRNCDSPFSMEELNLLFYFWVYFDYRIFYPGSYSHTRKRPKTEELISIAQLLIEKPQFSNELGMLQEEITFLKSGLQTNISWYRIDNTRPSIDITLTDIFTNETKTVREHKASESLSSGSVIMARIINLFGVNAFIGMFPQAMGPETMGIVLDDRDHILSLKHAPMQDPEVPLWMLMDHAKRATFAVRTNSIRERYQNPKIINYDGDPIEPYKIDWKLISPIDKIAELIQPLLRLNQAQDESRLEIKYLKDRSIKSFETNLVRAPINKDKEPVLLASVKVTKNIFSIEVNSKRRAEEVQSLINNTFVNHLVFHKSTKIRFNFSKKPKSNKSSNRVTQNIEELEDSPEIKQFIAAQAKKYWDTWFDTPIPALNNSSPREASKTERGRELLEALFLFYARMDKVKKAGDPFIADIDHIRAVLGLGFVN
jgi:hypothetical protein